MTMASMAQATESCIGAAAVEYSRYGKPHFDNRFSDKILAAHNHAYASGDTALADDFLKYLRRVEQAEVLRLNAATSGPFGGLVRRKSSAVGQAQLWRAYIDARGLCSLLAGRYDETSGEVVRATNAMKQCYAKWMLS